MPTDDRDERLERALRRQLRNAPVDWACPDAETLSAYHDGLLEQTEIDRWREHIAQCARCQESLRLVVATEELAEEASKNDFVLVNAPEPSRLPAEHVLGDTGPSASLGQREASEAVVASRQKRGTVLSWRWALPLGALAASAIVWVGFREIQKSRSQPARMMVAVTQPATQAPSIPAAELNARSPLGTSTAEKTARTASPERPAKRTAEQVAAAPREGVGGGVGGGLFRNEDRVQSQDQELARALSSGANQERDLKNADSAAVAAETSRAREPVSAGQPAPRTNEPGPESAPLPSVTRAVVVSSAAPRAKEETATRVGTAGASMGLLESSRANPRYVFSPGGNRVWRLGDGGEIGSSTDGGRTWEPQTSGVQNDLMVGSAASDRVCWVAGKSGTVLLTRDGGKHWIQIVSPIEGEIGGIHAVDAQHASLWDQPKHRSFETSDGGVTWIPSANP